MIDIKGKEVTSVEEVTELVCVLIVVVSLCGLSTLTELDT